MSKNMTEPLSDDPQASSNRRSLRCPLCGQTFAPDAAADSELLHCPDDGALLVTGEADELVGTVIEDKYKITEFLGAGGWGRVYKAQHLLLKQQVAIKFLSAAKGADARAVSRYRQEAQAASKLHHPNIASVREFDVMPGGTPYMVMTYVEGQSLSDLLKDTQTLGWQRAVTIAIQLADALAYAHRNGVIHRDVKPGNVLIEAAGTDQESAKVVDFGIATFLDEEESVTSRLTRTGEVFGTPAYMSPEQCQGHRVDPRSEVYSLGCLLFEMLNGAPPFAADTSVALIMKQMNDLAVFTNKNVPWTVQSVVLRALEKLPGKRYQSMDEMRLDLELVRKGDRPTRGRSKLALSPNQVRKLAWSTATVLCLGTAGWILWGTYVSPNPLEQLNMNIMFHPNNSQLYVTRGRLYAQFDSRNAISDFNQAIRLNPQDVMAYTWRSAAYADLGIYDKALEDAEHAIKMDANIHQAHLHKAIAENGLEHYENALAEARTAIKLNPKNLYSNNLPGYINCSIFNSNLRRYKDAVADADAAILLAQVPGQTVSQHLGEAYEVRSTAQLGLANYTQAASDAQNAIKFFPSGATVGWLNLARASNGLKKYDNALEIVDQLLTARPDLAQAHAVKAETWLGLNKKQEAITEIETALLTSPRDLLVRDIAERVARATGQAIKGYTPDGN